MQKGLKSIQPLAKVSATSKFGVSIQILSVSAGVSQSIEILGRVPTDFNIFSFAPGLTYVGAGVVLSAIEDEGENTGTCLAGTQAACAPTVCNLKYDLVQCPILPLCISPLLYFLFYGLIALCP